MDYYSAESHQTDIITDGKITKQRETRQNKQTNKRQNHQQKLTERHQNA